MKLSLLTNQIAPYRIPFLRELAKLQQVKALRVLTCVSREIDREWQVERKSFNFREVPLSGYTLNLQKDSDSRRILHFRFGIVWELLRHRPDRLIIGDASWTTFIAVACALLLQIPYTIWNEITTSSKVSAGPVAQLRRLCYRHAHTLVASCGAARDFLIQQRANPKRIKIVWNAIDNEYFLEQRRKWEPQRESLRAELNIPANAYCFIFVGQLIQRKRILETIQLLHDAQNDSPRPIHLIIAGSGPLEEKARSLANSLGFASHLHFTGFTKPDRLSQLYIAADRLILLSDDEPWGMVVNEALLFDKPFVCSQHVGAAREFKSIEGCCIRNSLTKVRILELTNAAQRMSNEFDWDPKYMANAFASQ